MPAVGPYEYSEADLIGHGAFALVFRGRRTRGQEAVAVKKIALKSVPGKLSSIRQKEIQILKDLQHPNIVQLHYYQETKTDIFLVMEYCNGGDMGDYLQSKKTLSEDSIRHLTRHIAGALRAISRLRIMHRDIKPQNLLLSYAHARRDKWQFKEAVVKLADFGFARYLTGADLATTLCGSPLYMAPEILLGRHYDSVADLWSVGTILFQCWTGTAPFLASNPHALRKRYEKEQLIPKVPAETPHFLADLLRKLLKKNPQDRLSHDAFFGHPFLKDPSELTVSAASLPKEQPSLRTKSSPVPIRRRTPLISQHSTSPHRGSLEGSADVYMSPSSGPPNTLRVASYVQSPPLSDVTDHGFVIITAANSGSRHSSFSSHPSTSPSSYCSAASHTPSSSSSSLTRYASLTTPFYQASLKNAPVSLQTTEAGSGIQIPTSSPLVSRSSKRRTSEPCAAALAHTPPFGRLVQQQHSSNSSFSSHSGPHSNTHSLPRRTSPSPSPISTPPTTSLSPSPRSYALSSQLLTPSHGIRYLSSAPGSGTKLSSLVEHAESNITPVRLNFHRSDSGPKLMAGDDFVTQSQLLHSDDEDDFPLSLSLTSSHASTKTDEQEDEQFSGVDVYHKLSAFRGRGSVSPQSKVSGGHDDAHSLASLSPAERVGEAVLRPRRAASFSHKKTNVNAQLAGSFDEIHRRSASLISGEDHVSPSATIQPIQPLFSTPSFSSSARLRTMHDVHSPLSSLDIVDLDVEDVEFETSGSLCVDAKSAAGVILSALRRSGMLARELMDMAQVRRGPIMLLSTDLSDSGIVHRVQRCSEQLVLCAKAVSILEAALRQYQIGVAADSLEPSLELRQAEEETKELKETCLEKAKQVKEQLLQCVGGRRPERPKAISAERLLFSEAMDVCKGAVLDEQVGDVKECIKRYKRAKLILYQLLFDASSTKDKAVLQSYILSIQKRISHLAPGKA